MLVFVAAVASAPLLLLAEGFDGEAVERVLLSNGVCVVFCLGLMALLRRGHVAGSGTLLVLGLLGIVSWWAAVVRFPTGPA